MRFIISRLELTSMLNKLQNIVPPKAPVPIMNNFMLVAKNNEIILTATDLVVGLRCFASAKVIEEGTVTLPTRRMAQLLREITSTNVELIAPSQGLSEIIADASRFKINAMSSADFPSFPELLDSQQVKFKQGELKEALYRTVFAVSREEDRFPLTGVLFRFHSGQATFIGTDGKRLAKARLSNAIDPSLTGDYIIPLKAVEEIIKILTDSDDVATLYLQPDQIALEANKMILVAKLLAGDYPDTDRVIPIDFSAIISIHREELISLLKQISLFIEDSTHSVRFLLSNGDLRITANCADIGEGKVSMPVNYTGPNLEIAFNPTYFLDILRHSKKDALNLGVIDGFNPGVITESEDAATTEGTDGLKINPLTANPLFVLMPMRLNNE